VSISGKFLTATIGTTPIDGTHEWSVQETVDALEATDGASGGRAKKDFGVTDTKIRVTFYLDVTTGAYTFIRAGTSLTNLALYADANSATPLYVIGDASVFSATVRGQIRDRFIVDAEIEAYGDCVVASDPN
jgi:hypothetical protein